MCLQRHPLFVTRVTIFACCCTWFCQVMVKDVADESNMSCSGAFTLLPAAPTTSSGGSMTVTSPTTGDLAMAGETYTVLVRGGEIALWFVAG